MQSSRAIPLHFSHSSSYQLGTAFHQKEFNLLYRPVLKQFLLSGRRKGFDALENKTEEKLEILSVVVLFAVLWPGSVKR